MPIFKKVNKDFFKTWTHEMAYVLGFFAADGYITVNKRGGHFWCIQICDKELLEQIKKCVGSEHKISIRTRKGNESDIFRLQIGSKEMCNDLRKLGMRERKTKSLSVPSVPDEYFSDFVRGYFDGDGSVWVGQIHKERKTKSVAIRSVFTSCSGDFLESLRVRMESFGILSGVLRKEKDSYYRLIYSVRGSLKLYDFMYNHEVSLSESLLLNRKKSVFEKFIEMQP